VKKEFIWLVIVVMLITSFAFTVILSSEKIINVLFPILHIILVILGLLKYFKIREKNNLN